MQEVPLERFKTRNRRPCPVTGIYEQISTSGGYANSLQETRTVDQYITRLLHFLTRELVINLEVPHALFLIPFCLGDFMSELYEAFKIMLPRSILYIFQDLWRSSVAVANNQFQSRMEYRVAYNELQFGFNAHEN